MVEKQIINFISGHLDLTQAEFDQNYRLLIDQALANNQGFVVGDARGTDLRVQQYLWGKTEAVIVYHMFTKPRHNVGFPTRGGFQSDTERDEQMTSDSHQDIAWVRPGREHSGTQANIDRRLKIISQK